MVEKEFQGMEFTEELKNRVAAKVKVVYNTKKSSVYRQKKSFMTAKVNAEKKLEIAEEKLISGVLSDSAYTRVKDKLREQIENLDDEIYSLERSKNLKMDIIQEVLSMVRNIGATYKKASPELKRLYLGLFWEKFVVAERKIVKAEKAPIISSLEAIGALKFNPKRKTTPNGSFANQEVILTTGWGRIVLDVRAAVMQPV